MSAPPCDPADGRADVRGESRLGDEDERAQLDPGIVLRRCGHGCDSYPATAALGLGRPTGLDADETTTTITDVVLAVVQQCAPTGALQRVTVGVFDPGPSLCPRPRSPHGLIVNETPCGTSVPTTCDLPVDNRTGTEQRPARRTPLGAVLRGTWAVIVEPTTEALHHLAQDLGLLVRIQAVEIDVLEPFERVTHVDAIAFVVACPALVTLWWCRPPSVGRMIWNVSSRPHTVNDSPVSRAECTTT
jgi:hypothetical protein